MAIGRGRHDRTTVLDFRSAARCGPAPCGCPPLERTVRLSPPCSRRVEVTVTTGTIKKVVSDRGFGFIAADDGKEYFFHRNGLTSSLDFDRLSGGEKVQFEIEASPRARARRTSRAPDQALTNRPHFGAGGFFVPARAGLSCRAAPRARRG